jgi:hypothetical protein
MNLSEIRFKAVEASGGCSKFLFRGESYRTCVTISDRAVQRGMPDCDDLGPNGKPYVYVLDETDPRQMNLLDKDAALHEQ